ncbi:hypothetical protein ACLOJK_018078 [Asimina triloba]
MHDTEVNLKRSLQVIKLLVKVFDRLVICLHWRRLARGVYLQVKSIQSVTQSPCPRSPELEKRRNALDSETNPDDDFVLERMGKLVTSKKDIGVPVELPACIANGPEHSWLFLFFARLYRGRRLGLRMCRLEE